MATIKCPKCNNLIAEETKKCPYCGYLFEEVTESNNQNTQENISENEEKVRGGTH